MTSLRGVPASAKQIIVVADGPATLGGNGHIRRRGLLDIARTEARAHDGGPVASEVAASRSS